MHESNLARPLSRPTDRRRLEEATVVIPVEVKVSRELATVRPRAGRAAPEARQRVRRAITVESGIYRPFRVC